MDLKAASSLEITVLVDNDLDPISHYNHVADSLVAYGNLVDIGLSGRVVNDRGTGHPAPAGPFPPIFNPPDGNVAKDGAPVPIRELRMDHICCSGHGLSLLITACKGDEKKTVLFDTGPDEDLWESNVKKLKADLSNIEVIILSHWHRDHSGGLIRAIKMINAARQASGKTAPVKVDVHPNRPDFRGFQLPTAIISLEADPTFEEIQQAGATLITSAELHTILDDMFLVSGEIPRKTAYEQGIRAAMRYSKNTGKWTPDPFIMDERFLMCMIDGDTRKGAMVFTGCGHAGIVNTCLNAFDILKQDHLSGVFGGFHLADADNEKLESTIKDLQVHVKDAIFFPGHCTGWRAQQALEKVYPGHVAPSKVGMKFTVRN